MDIRRVILYAAFALVTYSLWNNWQIENPPQQEQKAAAALTPTDKRSLPTVQLMPEMVDTSGVVSQPTESTSANKSKSIHVQNDVLDMTIDLQHGDIINANLLNYPVSIAEKDMPFTLLQNDSNERYVANSNIFTFKIQNFTSNNLAYRLPLIFTHLN